ncbi:MAG TPA: hypothetical protein DCX53_15730 [Anaerolineae bacterium]|nr:hypothetical protein [Anaerolineae bacterium]
MTPEVFVEWLRRQGYKVIKTPASYWVEVGPRVFQAFPYHWVVSPGEDEIGKLLLDEKALAIRYSTLQTSHAGSLSYHVVLDKKQYTLKDLPRKARYDVKKGLSVASVEPIPLSLLSSEGWSLRRDTLARQGRLDAETEKNWHRLCLSANGLDGFEAWGAFVQGKLVAALLAILCDDHFCILYHQSLTEYLSFGVNNALTFIVTSDVLNRLDNQISVFYGLQSLDAPYSVDKFKFRMGYTAKPVRQRVAFHPWVNPLMNKTSHMFLRGGLRLRPDSSTLSKAEGLLRFYLQGRMPLSEQTPPPPLRAK